MTTFLDHNIIRLYELAQMWRELRDLRNRMMDADSTLSNHVRNIGTEITGEYPGLNMEQIDDLREQCAEGIVKVFAEEIDRLSASELTAFKVERQKVRYGETPKSAPTERHNQRQAHIQWIRDRIPADVADEFEALVAAFNTSPNSKVIGAQFQHVYRIVRSYDSTDMHDQFDKLRALIREVPGLQNV